MRVSNYCEFCRFAMWEIHQSLPPLVLIPSGTSTGMSTEIIKWPSLDAAGELGLKYYCAVREEGHHACLWQFLKNQG